MDLNFDRSPFFLPSNKIYCQYFWGNIWSWTSLTYQLESWQRAWTYLFTCASISSLCQPSAAERIQLPLLAPAEFHQFTVFPLGNAIWKTASKRWQSAVVFRFISLYPHQSFPFTSNGLILCCCFMWFSSSQMQHVDVFFWLLSLSVFPLSFTLHFTYQPPLTTLLAVWSFIHLQTLFPHEQSISLLCANRMLSFHASLSPPQSQIFYSLLHLVRFLGHLLLFLPFLLSRSALFCFTFYLLALKRSHPIRLKQLQQM